MQQKGAFGKSQKPLCQTCKPFKNYFWRVDSLSLTKFAFKIPILEKLKIPATAGAMQKLLFASAVAASIASAVTSTVAAFAAAAVAAISSPIAAGIGTIRAAIILPIHI